MNLNIQTYWNTLHKLGGLSEENIKKAIEIMETKISHIKAFGAHVPPCGSYYLYYDYNNKDSFDFMRSCFNKGGGKKIEAISVPIDKAWLLFDERHDDCIVGMNS